MPVVYGKIAEIFDIYICQEKDENNLPKETYCLSVRMRIGSPRNCTVYDFGSNLILKENVPYLERKLKEMYGYSNEDDIKKLIGKRVAIYGNDNCINRIKNPANNKSIKLKELSRTHKFSFC